MDCAAAFLSLCPDQFISFSLSHTTMPDNSCLQKDMLSRSSLATALLTDLLHAQPLLQRSISLEHASMRLDGDSIYLLFPDRLLCLVIYYLPSQQAAYYCLTAKDDFTASNPPVFLALDTRMLGQAIDACPSP